MPSNTLVSGTPQKNDQAKRNTGLFPPFCPCIYVVLVYPTLKVAKGIHHLEQPGFFAGYE